MKIMLLTLKNEKTGEYYDVLRKKKHLVTRSGFNGDLEISGDSSISRFHAEISLIKKVINGKIKFNLEIKDTNSKYGTYINDDIYLNKRIENCVIVLKSGDRVRFGAMDSIWTVVEYPIIVCPSTLKMADKEILTKTVMSFGGQVTNKWTDQCTHLCMNSITITEKVLLCLASAKSIVPSKYFIDLCEALSPGSLIDIPFCMDYKPDFSENLINPNSISLNVNHKRKILFSGKTFICSTEQQLNRISKTVKAAGGDIINYFDGIMSDKDILNDKENIIMQQDLMNTENEEKYQLILEKLKINNKKPIPENEIGLAIIFANTTVHCNPDHNVPLVNLQSQSSLIEAQQPSVVLAPETEILTVESSEICSVNVIPDSFIETFNVKRPLEMIMESEEIVMPKKRALSNSKEITNKKIRTDEDLLPNLPSINICKNTKINNISMNVDSCITTVPSSQETSNKFNLSTSFQPIINNTNINNTNNINLETGTINKRKMPDIDSMFNDEEDPFNYMDIDEIEEPKKKSKKEVELILPVTVKSRNTNEQTKSTEININNIIDPNLIMNLLATAKGNGQFIDPCNSFNKSSFAVYKDSEDNDLLNSVIVETVSLVVSKHTKTQNVFQENNSYLKNFKKFKRKAPAMKIPYIVPLQLSQID